MNGDLPSQGLNPCLFSLIGTVKSKISNVVLVWSQLLVLEAGNHWPEREQQHYSQYTDEKRALAEWAHIERTGGGGIDREMDVDQLTMRQSSETRERVQEGGHLFSPESLRGLALHKSSP